MAEGGFDDIETKNRNIEEEEEEERRNEETSFNNEDELARSPRSHNKSINLINTSNPKSKYSRVDYRSYIPDIKMLDL